MQDLSFSRTQRHGPRPVPAWDRLDARGSDKPEPVSQQTPRKFCVILLKGMQTRWADDVAQLLVITDALNAAADMHVVYEYSAVFGRYSLLLEEAGWPSCTPSAP